jgi:hypothetical protein
MRRILLASSALIFVSGCATTSFAPPIVNMDKELGFTRTQTFFNATCTPNDNVTDAKNIYRTTEGALLLINNFILTYRCQAHRAAEGRQFFEVPGFIAAAGGATAAALGAGPNVAIGTGATNAVLGQGKSYYAPKDKAVVLDDGLDALICIKNEAVGIDAYTLDAISDVQEEAGPPETRRAVAPGEPDNGPEIIISAERQYFDMVQASLFSVERVVAQRLSASGTPFDADGVIAEIEALKKKIDEAKDESQTPEQEGENVLDTPAPEAGRGIESTNKANAAKAKLRAAGAYQVGQTIIKLRTLQPKLQQCILRAKV